ncbi:MAG: phosphate ABC transporter permease subunit PstC, partial [Cyanobacteria bacterium J06641_5]
RAGLLTAGVLATGRALGETMAVLMVCGNIVQVPESFFDPVRALTANIALEMAYATDAHRSVLFVSGLVLLGLIAGLVAIVPHQQGGHHSVKPES